MIDKGKIIEAFDKATAASVELEEAERVIEGARIRHNAVSCNAKNCWNEFHKLLKDMGLKESDLGLVLEMRKGSVKVP